MARMEPHRGRPVVIGSPSGERRHSDPRNHPEVKKGGTKPEVVTGPCQGWQKLMGGHDMAHGPKAPLHQTPEEATAVRRGEEKMAGQAMNLYPEGHPEASTAIQEGN